ncbi:acyltransferase [Methanobrevibacter sp.]|uniref:acyltransferase n=1 Tax=Methanobrevibacter sp. TaxID=66852 RepID=UPI00386748DE
MSKTRIFYLDELRALAIIGIIFCHVSVSFVYSNMGSSLLYISAFFDCFRDFSIPIFVMISGALLLNREDSFKDFFKRRLSRLLIPFFFWVAIYVIYSFVYIYHGIDWSAAIDIFFGTSGTLGVAFWFIWMIIIAYFAIFLINKAISIGSKRYENFDNKFIGFLAVLSILYIMIVHFGFFSPYGSKIIYFLSFMSYIIIGYCLVNFNFLSDKISPYKIALVTLALFLASYFWYIFAYVVPVSMSHGRFIYSGYFNLLILLISVSLFLFFKYLSKTGISQNIENKAIGQVLSIISAYSFGIYLCHYVVLHRLKVNISKMIVLNNQNPLIWIPILVFLTLIISLVILWVLNKIPYLKKFSGKN